MFAVRWRWLPVSLLHKPIELPRVSTGPYPGRHYDFAESWAGVAGYWGRVVAAYEGEPGNFRLAWHYVNGHPAFWVFHQETLTGLPVDHCQRLNTEYGFHEAVEVGVGSNAAGQAVVWLEAGYCSLFPDEYGTYHGHDPRIDTHALTFEHAVVSLARKMWDLYGNDRRFCDAEEAKRKDAAGAVAESGEAGGGSGGGGGGGAAGEPAGGSGHSRWRGSWVGDQRVGGDAE
jgi:hypothetical protein